MNGRARRPLCAAPCHWLGVRGAPVSAAAIGGGAPGGTRGGGSMAGDESWRPPRPCEDYWWEWKHCRGLRHAFHHYYAHGELPACGRWREDYAACRAWEKDRAAAAREALRESERAPVLEQKKHGAVWPLRRCPPPDWHRPLEHGPAK
ncbi:UPF0545 protein C22orf39 homolog [Numida meleagris]|uniref:UPF0545 protein C22orf39 homolog n=1 Tax=Numida meleagris TaxID=8996 RepID=UPI000B3DED84|nr:UPF0545 protein C22orf39 homolog [Numida meleagris]